MIAPAFARGTSNLANACGNAIAAIGYDKEAPPAFQARALPEQHWKSAFPQLNPTARRRKREAPASTVTSLAHWNSRVPMANFSTKMRAGHYYVNHEA